MVDTVASLFVAAEIHSPTHATVRFHHPSNLNRAQPSGKTLRYSCSISVGALFEMLTDLKYIHLCLNDIRFRL
jgi:hypothetical protein